MNNASNQSNADPRQIRAMVQASFLNFLKRLVLYCFLFAFLLDCILVTIYLEIHWVFFFLLLLSLSFGNAVNTILNVIKKMKAQRLVAQNDNSALPPLRNLIFLAKVNECLAYIVTSLMMVAFSLLESHYYSFVAFPLVEIICLHCFKIYKIATNKKMKKKLIHTQVSF